MIALLKRVDPVYALVALVALCSYGAALGGDFVYDDLHSVRDNLALRDPSRILEYFWNPSAFSSLDNKMYRPVLLVTFALDHALGGGAVWVFKLHNLLLHAACAVTLTGLARAYGAARIGAGLAGALFAAHPLLSEAVNMVSARSELLMQFGILLALAFHERGRHEARGQAWLVAVATFLAVGAKEPGVLVPALLLLREALARDPGGCALRSRIARLVPALVVAVAYLVVRKIVLGTATAAVPALAGHGDPFSGGSRGLVAQLATMALVVPRCLFQAIVPLGISIDPQVPVRTSFADPFVISGSLGCAALVVYGWWRGRLLSRMGIGLALVCSGAWIVLPLNVMLAEHRLYGLLAGMAWVASAGLSLPGRPVRCLRVAALAAVGGFGVLAGARCLDYRDERQLWHAVLTSRPDSPRARCALGIAALTDGDLLAAREHLTRAVMVYPRLWRARRHLAMTELAMPRSESKPLTALVNAELVREQSPHDPFVRLLVAECLMAVGEVNSDSAWYVDAEKEALSCLEIAPPKGLVYIVAARARAKTGDVDGALGLLDTAIARGLSHGSVWLAKSDLLTQAGRQPEAVAILRRLLDMDPFDAIAKAAFSRLTAPSVPR